MDETARYAIPLPARYRVPPITTIPWSAFGLARVAIGSANSIAPLAREIRAAYGVRHCVLFDSARSAWAVLTRALGATGEILFPSLMHTPSAVLLANLGLKPTFCDVENDFCASVRTIEPAATTRTRCVVVTHMYGKVAPIDEIEAWARPRGIFVLSNMVHLPGALRLGGRPVASFGDAALVSFNMDKPLFGLHGGALLTDSDDLHDRIARVAVPTPATKKIAALAARYLLLYRYKPLLAPISALVAALRGGRGPVDDVARTFDGFGMEKYLGFRPSGIHPWQAALALRLLADLPAAAERRMSRARRAIGHLADVPGLALPDAAGRPHAFQYFPVVLDAAGLRYEAGAHLARRGIETKWRYYPLHLQKKFRAERAIPLPNAERLWARHLLLPVLHGTESDADFVTSSLASFLAARNA